MNQRIAIRLITLAALAPAAMAQFNNQWVTFSNQSSTRLKNPNGTTATQVVNDVDEKDYAWGDVNKDGWTDVVVARKQDSATTGRRPNHLLINEFGILVDRTAQFAADSDFPGDQGFLTPTNDRDVQIVDLNGDGWLDIVTATTLSDGQPKNISHPRVYRNKGEVNGVWQGFKYEDARIPQLRVFGSNLAVAPRFCSVSAGDVTGDGFPDLYFADYDDTETGITEPSTWDLNDRLLVNDGNGFFTDSGTSRMTSTMLSSAFGMASVIDDMNGDGHLDIVKDTALGSPQYVSIAYNNPASVGFFSVFQNNAGGGQPYHVDSGDLNNDGKMDIVISDDGVDYYRYNTGNDALGRVIWGPNRTFTFLSGGDGGFAGNNIMADLNDDGWQDIIICDVDVDVPGCSRRTNIFHNPGGAVGSQPILKEERQQASGGWIGAVGIMSTDLTGVYDVATLDIDNDGDLDLIFGRCSGTGLWINQTYAAPTELTFCYGDGTSTPCPCGNSSAVGANEGCLNSFGTGGRLRLSGVARIGDDTLHLNGSGMPSSSALYFQGTTQVAGGLGSVFGDGLRCAGGAVIRLGTKINVAGLSSYPSGADQSISVRGVVAAGDTRTYQIWYRNAAAFCSTDTFNVSNGAQVSWAP